MAMTKREVVFTFSGTHGAVAGEAALQEGGFSVRVMALPDQIGAGCGICLRVDESDAPEAQKSLEAAGISPEGVFLAEKGSEGTVYKECKL